MIGILFIVYYYYLIRVLTNTGTPSGESSQTD